MGRAVSRRKKMDSRQSSFARSTKFTGATLSKEERDTILEGWIGDDETGRKTMSRIVVEKYLSKYSWYWPRRNEKGAPQLSKAWAHYEHNILPRHFSAEDDAEQTGVHVEHVYRMAERGEKGKTELYPHLTLPASALIEWGSGMDLYFISLWFFAIAMFIAGCINLVSIIYFASSDYNGDECNLQNVGCDDSTSIFHRVSAICKNTDWVVCSTCQAKDWETGNAPDRFAEGFDPNGSPINLVKKNNCEFDDFRLGWPNLITLVFFVIAVTIFNFYLRVREIRFDEDKVTTSDYSIVVNNPPPDAKNPDEWHAFFKHFAQEEEDQVTVVTVALDNQDMINILATRRVYQRYLRMKLPADTDFDDEQALMLAIDKHNLEVAEQPVGCIGKMLNCIAPIFKLIGMMLNASELHERIIKSTEKVKELQEKEYHATKVLVTFETENGQRSALSALNVSQTDLRLNKLGAVDPDCRFRGELLLDVTEPAEPSAIRYLELSSSAADRLVRGSITLVITIALIAFAGWSVFRVREDVGPFLSGPLTSIFNSIMPIILKLLLLVERHPDEGSYQRSVYLKLTLFRWVLSGFLTSIITPFTHTLGDDPSDMIPTISAIIISDVWLTPLLRLSDYTTNLKKHVLAPRARSQAEMDSWFTGSWFQLGERYTDFTKIIFVVFYYSSLYPSGFFFGFVILLTQYYMDKFCLVRIWQPTPRLGADLATFSRRYFFTTTVVFLAVVSSTNWAQWPYDNLCPPDPSVTASENVVLYTDVTTLNKVSVGKISVDSSEDFRPCGQSWQDWAGTFLPATPRVQTGEAGWFATVEKDDLGWMSSSQTTFTTIYGWSAVVILLFSLFATFAGAMYRLFLSLFRGVYEEEGAVQNIDFSSNLEIFTYVPEVSRSGQPFPFLCCDIDDFDENTIAWMDSGTSYDNHNLIFDIPHPSLRRMEHTTDDGVQFDHPEMFGFHRSRYPGTERKKLDYANSIYSLVKHYPTKWQLAIAEKEGILFDD